jgi:hypothetical protein
MIDGKSKKINLTSTFKNESALQHTPKYLQEATTGLFEVFEVLDGNGL